jgi:hypothetical protein
VDSSTLAGCDAAGRAPEPAALLEAEVERRFQSLPRRLHRCLLVDRELQAASSSPIPLRYNHGNRASSAVQEEQVGSDSTKGVFCAGMIRAATFHPGLLAIRGRRSLLKKGQRSVRNSFLPVATLP